MSNVEGLPDYTEGQFIVIKDHMGRPIAVGKLATNVAAVKHMPEKKGKAVKVMHYLGDELWRLGTELVQLARFQQTEADKEEANTDQAQNEQSDNSDNSLEGKQEGEQVESKKEVEGEKEGVKEDEKKEKEEEKKDVKEEKEEKIEEKVTEGKEEVKDETDMDKVIYEAFMNALKLSVKDSHLPMEPSTLANAHMKCCTTHKIAFHLSSYKKVRIEE